MIRTAFPILFLLLIAFPVKGQDTEPSTGLLLSGPEHVTPKPCSHEIFDGSFSVTDGIEYFIMTGGNIEDTADLEAEIAALPFRTAKAGNRKDAGILISIGTSRQGTVPMSDEAYVLNVKPDGISIEARTAAGAFYALQSLIQMTGQSRHIRCCMISDYPRFGYRGLHFDVSRHFRSKEFLMKQMDAMALVKLNRMHLHLTDAAGWRLEIDAYPRLTEFAAWRPYRKWSDWWTSGRDYCEAGTPGAYGGYYTGEDIRDILDYARRKHIEIIPEIEMPGHSEEVIAAYPELSCKGRQYGSSDFCPGKEEVFSFLENVLDEVMALFPSEYVHIGGDEASKANWKDCPDCRKRMQEEGLADVDELQSYFIHRIGEFVNSRGRKIIGWDEIMQGGLAPDATVMSWRGTEAGLSAAKSGHDVIMTPNAYCYLDYTQDAPFKEPVSIGGYVPLEKVYSYEPVGPDMDGTAISHILGLQGNLWSEYITEDSKAEYMYYPRAFAIAETGWSRAEDKDFTDFRRRALDLTEMLGKKGYDTFDLENEYGERKESLSPLKHIAVDAAVDYSAPYHRKYPAGGEKSLTDGLPGGWSYGDGRWQGFLSDMDVTVDLGCIKPVHYIGATFMQVNSVEIYLPEKVLVSVSEDGQAFRPAGAVYRDLPYTADGLYFRTYGLVCDENCRFIRLHAVRSGEKRGWLFTDEIVVN